jgi:hypothetical protein
MKIIIIVFSLLLLVGCNRENELSEVRLVLTLPEAPLLSTSYFKYSLRIDNNNELVYTQEYSFDDSGKVISEIYTNANNPQYNHISEFKYSENGKLKAELRKNEIFTSIEWDNGVAEIYSSTGQKISEFIFLNNILVEYRIGFFNNNIQYRKFNYDTNGNVASIEDEKEIIVEFLEYDTSKLNPLNLIQSIGILRIDYKPFFENIFGVEKLYPYEDEDYSFPLTYYDYYYTFDSKNRVIETKDDKTLIYVSKFEYE